MKRFLPILIVLFTSTITLNAQVTISKKSIDIYQKIKPETIFIQQNKSNIFSGEQLFYKVYCLNKDNTAGISKIAYVELINNKKEAIFKHKISLDLATGYGDFVIPFSIPTGNYKLIGYTQWMRNAGATNFFVKDLFIINPFVDNKDVVSLRNKKNIKPKIVNNNSSSIIDLQLEKNKFNVRKKVTLKIKSFAKNQSFGNYTLSVKKANNIETYLPKTKIDDYKALQFNGTKNNFILNGKNYSVYAPEHKGELLTGKVVNIKNNKPISGIRVALSIPSKTFVIKMAETNKYGEFYFDLDKNFVGEKAIIQVSDKKRDKYKILLNNKAVFDYSKLRFQKLQLSDADIKAIKKKSEYIQIENAYREVKQDNFIETKPKVTFYKPDYTYHLNDFKRFPTVQETMVEIIDHTWVKTKRGKHTFIVRDYKSTRREDTLPMILIDGILVQNHEDLYNYDVKKIETINIITDKFLFENKVYGGVISVLTKEANFSPITRGEYLIEANLTKPLSDKKYFNQNYDNNLNQRVPDYRSQLLWNPNIVLNSDSKDISFFTSDNKGVYEIKLEGITYDGKAVSISKTITIE